MNVCHSTVEPRNRFPAPDAANSDQYKDFMLAVVRCAKVRVQLLATEIEEILASAVRCSEPLGLRWPVVQTHSGLCWNFL